MADRLVVIGSGGHAKVVVEAALARQPDREIIILDDAEESRGRSVLGVSVSGGRGELDPLRGTPVIVAVGGNHARAELVHWLKDQRHSLESIIHPRAIVADSVKVGAGVFVSAGAIVIAEARIGDGAIINTGASVDHDCDIGEAAHIAPGVHLCGNVRIGARTLVGVGSSVKPGVSIGADVVIGAGSVVVQDIAEAGTFVGVPARPLKLI
jgi:sugar O-acyltransferase (sialic acid O-acetyltransferase NeuD family)